MCLIKNNHLEKLKLFLKVIIKRFNNLHHKIYLLKDELLTNNESDNNESNQKSNLYFL